MSIETTTHEGVEEVEQVVESAVEPVTAPVNRRAEIMETLAAKRQAEMAHAPVVEPADEPPAEPPADQLEGDEPAADPVSAESPAEDTPAETAPPDPPVYQKDGEWMTKRKVNGVEEEVKFSELVAINQKMAAADETMRAAAAERAKVHAYEQRVLADATRQEEARRKAANVGATGAEQVGESVANAKKYHELLMKGDLDDEETQEKLAQLLVAMAPKQVDSRAIVDEASQIAQRQYKAEAWQRDVAQSDAWVQEKHPEIWDDVHLRQLATNEAHSIMNERVAQGRQTNPNFSNLDVNPKGVYEEAVQRTENWLKSRLPPATGNDPATSNEARVERKRSASGKTVAGNGAKVALKQAPKPRTQADVIADMRRSRGLSA